MKKHLFLITLTFLPIRSLVSNVDRTKINDIKMALQNNDATAITTILNSCTDLETVAEAKKALYNTIEERKNVIYDNIGRIKKELDPQAKTPQEIIKIHLTGRDQLKAIADYYNPTLKAFESAEQRILQQTPAT